MEGINVKVKDPITGGDITDIDIQTKNGAVQVKEGKNLGGLKDQMEDRTKRALEELGEKDKPVLGYAPNVPKRAMDTLKDMESFTTQDFVELIYELGKKNE